MSNTAEKIATALKVLDALASKESLAATAADAIAANNPALAPIKPLMALRISEALGKVQAESAKTGLLSRLFSWL